MSEHGEKDLLLGGTDRMPHSTGSLVESPALLEGQTIDSASKQIQQADVETKVYKRRWYIMMIYGLMAMTQCAVWNTFSPISDVGERVFHWNTATLSLLTNWGPISYLIATFIFSWILDEKGLRPACVISAFLVAAGSALRCISSEPSIATPLIHLGQFLNGLAGPIAMGGATVISAIWFPSHERATATALAVNTNVAGLAVSYLLGPYLVPVLKLHKNATQAVNYSFTDSDGIEGYFFGNSSANHTGGNSTESYDVDSERKAMMRYMYYSCGWSVFCFLCFFIYFPNKPPKPPSPTASLNRVKFLTGVKQLAKNRTFWLICLTYGLPSGILSCWNGVLDVNLKDHNISQTDAGWLGFYGVVAGVVSAFVVARGADIFSKRLKTFLVALFVVGSACFIIFAFSLIGLGAMPSTKSILYPSYIIGNFLMFATAPLFFEAACEATYPVAEGVTTLVLTLANNIAGLLFLFVQMIPNIGTMWENWCLVGGMVICIPILLTMKESYTRLDIDITVESSSNRANIGEDNPAYTSHGPDNSVQT